MRQFVRRLFGKPVVRTRRHDTRLGVEPLEAREMPAVDFVALATQVNQSLDVVQSTADRALDLSTVALPVVGKSARDLKGTFDQAMDGAQAVLRDAIRVLDPQAGVTAVQGALADALGRAGVLLDRNGNGFADAGDVSVTNYDPMAGSITIDLGLAKSAATAQRFNLGLKGVPLTVAGDVTAAAGVRYESLKFGLNRGSFFLDTSASNVIKVSLDAGVTPNTRMTATAGLFQVEATPLNAGTFGLHGGLAVNLGTGAATFYGSANADLALAGY